MRLYHILPSEFGVSNLALRRMKVSRVVDLNDPFELLPYKFENDEIRKAWERSKQKLHEIHGLLCFSKNWQNPVLWSHYGDKHRGICLGFDFTVEPPRHIDYISERLDFREISEDMATGYLYSKYEHWRYEDEYRSYVTLDHSTSENGLYFVGIGEGLVLREIILGPYCSIPLETLHPLVQSLGPGISLAKAALDSHQFRLVIDPSTKWVSPGPTT